MPDPQLHPDPADEPVDDAEAEEQDERLGALLTKHAHIIAEHCESVCIIATFKRGETPIYARISRGAGNYFAQYGSVKDWLNAQEQPDGV